MGSYKWGYGVPLRVPLKGSIGFLGFRGSYTWAISRVAVVITHIRGLRTTLITTPKP